MPPPQTHLLHIVLELQDGTVHDVGQAERFALVRKGGLGDGHHFLPVPGLDARLSKVFNEREDFLEVRDFAQQHLVCGV